MPQIVSAGPKLLTTILGLKLDMTPLVTALKSELITPYVVASSSSSLHEIRYDRATEVCWLPPPLSQFVFFQDWLGMKIFPTHVLKEHAWSSLWTRSLVQVTESMLRSRKKYFKLDSSVPTQIGVALLSAIGNCIKSSVPISETAGTSTTAETEAAFESMLAPSFEHWPVLRTQEGMLVTASEVVWPVLNFFKFY